MGYAFKIQASFTPFEARNVGQDHPLAGQVTYMRVYQGKVGKGDSIEPRLLKAFKPSKFGCRPRDLA